MKNMISILPILTGICFGSVGVFVRILYGAGFNNMAVLASRTIIASALLFIFISFRDRDLLKIKKPSDLLILAGGGILGMTLTNVFFNISVNALSMAFTGVLLSLAPAFVVLFSAVLFREKITPKKIICILLAFAGAVLVSNVIGSSLGRISLGGVITGVLSGMSLSMTSIFTKLAIGRGYQGMTITFYSILTTAIVTSPLANWTAIIGYASSGFENAGFLLLHAVITAALPYLVYNVSLNYIEAGKAAILAACEPVAAMIFGLLFYEEQPSVLSITGLFITVIALTVMSIEKKKGAN